MRGTKQLLSESIRTFPVVRWIRNHTSVPTVSDTNSYADCPICGGSQKLQIKMADKWFRCFRCTDGGHHGDRWSGTCGLIEMISLLEGISRKQAVQKIYKEAGISDVYYETNARLQLYESELPNDAIASIGCPNHASSHYLHDRGVSHLLDSCFVCVTGLYSRRVILPCQFFEEAYGFEAKSYDPSVKPKTLYPPWFKTPEYVYTTQAWDHRSPFCVITESILDAETLRTNAVGIYGSVLAPGQLSRLLKLRDMGVTRLVWMLDGDAFFKQSRSILGKTLGLFHNYIVALESTEDPNDLGYDECWNRVANATEIKDELDIAKMALVR